MIWWFDVFTSIFNNQKRVFFHYVTFQKVKCDFLQFVLNSFGTSSVHFLFNLSFSIFRIFSSNSQVAHQPLFGHLESWIFGKSIFSTASIKFNKYFLSAYDVLTLALVIL